MQDLPVNRPAMHSPKSLGQFSSDFVQNAIKVADDRITHSRMTSGWPTTGKKQNRGGYVCALLPPEPNRRAATEQVPTLGCGRRWRQQQQVARPGGQPANQRLGLVRPWWLPVTSRWRCGSRRKIAGICAPREILPAAGGAVCVLQSPTNASGWTLGRINALILRGECSKVQPSASAPRPRGLPAVLSPIFLYNSSACMRP